MKSFALKSLLFAGLIMSICTCKNQSEDPFFEQENKACHITSLTHFDGGDLLHSYDFHYKDQTRVLDSITWTRVKYLSSPKVHSLRVEYNEDKLQYVNHRTEETIPRTWRLYYSADEVESVEFDWSDLEFYYVYSRDNEDRVTAMTEGTRSLDSNSDKSVSSEWTLTYDASGGLIKEERLILSAMETFTHDITNTNLPNKLKDEVLFHLMMTSGGGIYGTFYKSELLPGRMERTSTFRPDELRSFDFSYELNDHGFPTSITYVFRINGRNDFIYQDVIGYNCD